MISNGMKRRSRPLFVTGFLLLTLLSSAAPVLADGGFFSAPEREIWESSQIAFIQLADGLEDLKILPGFNGTATDFAWIVPVPAVPELATADPELFYEAATLTQPVYKHRDAEWGCEQREYAIMNPDGVQIISEEVVGMYDTMVLGADNPDALADSLTEWGFLHAENIATVTPVLESYVYKGWVFVAMKVNEATLEEELPYLQDYWYGQMQPIRLTFPSEEMVYPLHISSLSSTYRSEVVIYTVGEHRMTYPGAETWYANKISASELSAISSRFPAVGAELAAGDFLTKLVREYSPSQMSADLVLTPAGADDEFRLVNYSGFPLFNLLLGGSLLGWLGMRWTLWRRKSRKVVEIGQ